MPPSTHRAEALSWRVMKSNSPVVGRNPAPAPASLQFLSAPLRLTAHDAGPRDLGAEAPLGTVFQAAGSLLIEVPLSGELNGPPPLFGFVARHQA